MAAACGRFPANSLKALQRRVVARKRRRSNEGVAVAVEDSDSAISICDVATMMFIEPLFDKDLCPAAKKQCQGNDSELSNQIQE